MNVNRIIRLSVVLLVALLLGSAAIPTTGSMVKAFASGCKYAPDGKGDHFLTHNAGTNVIYQGQTAWWAIPWWKGQNILQCKTQIDANLDFYNDTSVDLDLYILEDTAKPYGTFTWDDKIICKSTLGPGLGEVIEGDCFANVDDLYFVAVYARQTTRSGSSYQLMVRLDGD